MTGIFYGIVAVTYLSLLSTQAQSVCDDVDATGCQILARSDVNYCSDPCLAKLCPRSCGNCPLKCYKCQEVDSPGNCRNVSICNDNTYECITTESYSDNFQKVYKLGCAPRSICDQTFPSPGNVIGRRDGDSVGCCSTDLCNSFTSAIKRSANKHEFSGSNTDKLNNKSLVRGVRQSTCTDINTEACRRFVAAHPTGCSDSCLASVCEGQCGTCKKCYNCGHVARPEDCTHTTTCQRGEKCYALEVLNGDTEHGFRLGCMEDTVCNELTSPASPLGKRALTSQTFACCNSSLCNNGVLQHTITTQTVPTSGCDYSGCPAGFKNIDGKCYMLSPKTSYYNASNFCKSHCSRLVENFSSLADIQSVAVYLMNHTNVPHLGAHFVYIGASSIQHPGDEHLRWESTGERIHLHVSHLSHYDKNVAYCGTVVWGLHLPSVFPVKCTSPDFGLCEAEIK